MTPDACVIGGGPAGLAAAEVLAGAGHGVLVADAMPSVGRKFLMAGKSGLNLTRREDRAAFEAQFSAPHPSLTSFGPDDVTTWAEGLGQPLFAGSTGRVFPTAMKASPLLRAWLSRLGDLGVTFRTRWRWTGWDGASLTFDSPEGPHSIHPKATVLALGGASWRRLGSDGAWTELLAKEGVALTPFKPANIGFTVDWSPHMTPHFGTPVKGTRLSAGTLESRGEWIVSARGLEGGGIYMVSRAVRDGTPLAVDLMPDVPTDQIATRLSKPRGKQSLTNHIRKALGLDPLRRALLMEFGRPLPDGDALAHLIKTLPIRHTGPRPMDEAISVAGGVSWQAVDDTLMLKAKPGTFVAGEMMDWEAQTGGYLLTGCLSTGRHAGQAAARWLS